MSRAEFLSHVDVTEGQTVNIAIGVPAVSGIQYRLLGVLTDPFELAPTGTSKPITVSPEGIHCVGFNIEYHVAKTCNAAIRQVWDIRATMYLASEPAQPGQA